MKNFEDRDQGPHYIPELDPENAQWPQPFNRRPMWIAFVASAVLMATGLGSVLFGFSQLGLILFLIGLLVLAPFVAFIG